MMDGRISRFSLIPLDLSEPGISAITHRNADALDSPDREEDTATK
jgi:hypothetical protein